MTRKLENKEVVNPVRSIRINVTEEDIRAGKPLDPGACAIAQCIVRSTRADAAYVHRGVTYILIGKKWHRYATSAAARMETIVFDRGGQFMPGEYDLHPMPVSLSTAKKKSPSRPRTTGEAELGVRRRVIPGVRRSARASSETEE